MYCHLWCGSWARALVLGLCLVGCGEDAPDHQRDDGEGAASEVDASTPRDGGGAIDGGLRDAAATGDASSVDAAAPDAGRDHVQARPIAAGLEVPTDEGAVLGKQVGKTRAFLGIPYAKPPVGALRWRAPEAPERHAERLDASKYGAICPQALPVIGWDGRASEDCLTVNIWTPDPAPSSPLPVMVFLHGGAYQLGSGGDQYDGQKLSEAGQVVVVTLNYRLGALGFLTHRGLSGENPTGGSGNYGIRDQQRALAWIRANISAFGGDDDNVTLFGESAGGNSVCLHLISPKSDGLFDKAIVQSGLCLKQPMTQADSDALGDRLAGELGCAEGNVLECLRKVDARRITERTAVTGQYPGGVIYLDPAQTYFPQPTIDGEIIPAQPEVLFARGFFHKVPVLSGANTDEGALFHMPFPMGGQPIYTRGEFQRLIGRLFGQYADEIERTYAPPASPTWNDALSQVSGDMLFLCQSRRFAAYLERGGQPSYLYRFNAPLEGLLLGESSGRAIHSADIPYVFGNEFALGSIPAAKRPLIAAMQGYWTRFARTGDPNGGAGPAWRPYAAAQQEEYVLDEPVSIVGTTKRAQCDLWQRISGL